MVKIKRLPGCAGVYPRARPVLGPVVESGISVSAILETWPGPHHTH